MAEAPNAPDLTELTVCKEQVPDDPVPKNPLRRIALAVAILAAILFAASVALERRTPLTSQAVVQSYIVLMAAEVGGRVTEIGVIDNAQIKAGQLLFRIDPLSYRLAVNNAEAQLEAAGLAIGANIASVDAAQATLVSARAQRDNEREQARRVSLLIEGGAIARAQLDASTAALGSAEAAVSKAQADLQRARQQLGSEGNDNPQLKQALAALEKARLDLIRTEVVAPSDGVVTNLQLAVGQVVSPGQPALTVIDASTVWVSANLKENSLEHVGVNDPAELVFDLLPGRVFKGRVDSVGWGVAQEGSSQYALPSVRNPSGWVRDPQRFPVRLIVDEPHPTGPRYGSQVTVVIYADDNLITNAIGSLIIRLGAWLNYVN